jgi:glycine/D-amino acid oxidase-like deaminating enzyme
MTDPRDLHGVPELGNSRMAETRVADRPIPDDGFPSVGAVPSVPGYYEAVSHSGITLGPVIGRLLASEIFSGRTDDMLADFYEHERAVTAPARNCRCAAHNGRHERR